MADWLARAAEADAADDAAHGADRRGDEPPDWMRAKLQAYNGQVAVDGERQIIVACRRTNSGSDQDGLLTLLDATAANTGRMPREVSADAGFCSHDNLAGLIDRKVRGTVATGRASRPASGTTGSGLVQETRVRIRQGGDRSRYRLRKCVVEQPLRDRLQVDKFRHLIPMP